MYVVQFLTGLSSASAMFLIAAGLSLIFGVTRIVNFAHGSLYMLGAYMAYVLINALGPGLLQFGCGILLAAVAVGLIGSVVEVSVLRRIYQAPEMFQLVATFGVILVIQDLALWVFGPEDLLGPQAPGLKGVIVVMGEPLPQYDLVLIAISPLVLAALWLLLNRTRWGILVRAATEDRHMVSALGVNQRWLFTGVFFLGSALAGLGGAVQLPKGGANLLMDFNVIATAFVVVVVGGMESITGAYLAAVLIGELQAFGILVFPEITLVLMFLIMAVVLVFRPWGLLGKPEATGYVAADSAEPLRPAAKPVRWAGLAVLILLGVMPAWANDFTLVLAIEIALMALFAAALHFIMGPGGMVSFGHAAFFGGGAYAAALLMHHLHTPMEVSLVLAPLLAGVLALIVGWFSVRLSGVYLAMLTLSFAQIAWSIVFQWDTFTYGSDGILGIWPSAWASPRLVFYYLTMAFVVVGILALRGFLFAPFGYAMRAGRDSPLRSEAIGINVPRQHWLAFALSGVFAGLAGGLYVFSKGSVFPDEMSIPRSFDALIMVLLGGVQTLSGPIVGAAVFTWLQDLISRVEYWRFLLGMAILLLVLVFPQGLAGYTQQRWEGWLGWGEEEDAT